MRSDITIVFDTRRSLDLSANVEPSPQRQNDGNRPMRSSPFKTTATQMTVDMAPLPPEKCKAPPVPMPAPPIEAGIAASVTARLTRRRSPHAASAGLIHLGVSTPYH